MLCESGFPKRNDMHEILRWSSHELHEEYLYWSAPWIHSYLSGCLQKLPKVHDRHRWDIRIAKFWMTTEFDPYLEVTHSHHSTLLWCQWCLQWSDNIGHPLFWSGCGLHCLHQLWNDLHSNLQGRKSKDWLLICFRLRMQVSTDWFNNSSLKARYLEQCQLPTTPRVLPKLVSDSTTKKPKPCGAKNPMQPWRLLCFQLVKPLSEQNPLPLSRQLDWIIRILSRLHGSFNRNFMLQFKRNGRWNIHLRLLKCLMSLERNESLSLDGSRNTTGHFAGSFPSQFSWVTRKCNLVLSRDCLQYDLLYHANSSSAGTMFLMRNLMCVICATMVWTRSFSSNPNCTANKFASAIIACMCTIELPKEMPCQLCRLQQNHRIDLQMMQGHLNRFEPSECSMLWCEKSLQTFCS